MSDPRYPFLSYKPATSTKKTDPNSKNRIVSDDSQIDIFKLPDTEFLKSANVNLLPVSPFGDYSKGCLCIDLEWVGVDRDGNYCESTGDPSKDRIVAIGLKYQGHYAIACNKEKSERDLLYWFWNLILPKLKGCHTIYGYNIYGGNRKSDLHYLLERSKANFVSGCPWIPEMGNWSTYRWNNAIVFGKPLEAQRWNCNTYQLIDLYPQTVSYDSLVRKLDNYSLKTAVIGFGLRKDRRIEIGAEVWKYWEKGDTETITEYLKYDLDDTEMLWNFLIPQKYFMQSYMIMDLQRITTTGTGSWWNQYLVKQIGCKPDHSPVLSYQGALTFYQAGVYRNCAKFDFSGLYPSIMLTWLICSIKDTNYVSLKTLQFLLQYRKKIKKSEAFKSGCKDADGQQHTAKILANSLYGLWNTLGLSFNDPYAGAAVTAYGRCLARYMIDWLDAKGVSTVACFAAGTLVMTSEGDKPIESLLDSPTFVLNGNGDWVETQFVCHGKQQIWKLTLVNNGDVEVIRTTSNHRWKTVKNGWKTTEDLLSKSSFNTPYDKGVKKFDEIPFNVANRPDSDNPEYRLGLVHGIVYGDGSEDKLKNGNYAFNCSLYQEKRELLSHFIESNLDGSIDLISMIPDDRVVESIRVRVQSKINLKRLPVGFSPSYLLGFFRGLLATDGNVSGKDGCPDISGTYETVKFIESITPIIGVISNRINISNFAGRTTIIRGRECTQKKDLHRIFFAKNSMLADDFLRSFHKLKWQAKFSGRKLTNWAVISVEPTDRYEEVYCCEEKETHTFTLTNNILCGNCDTDGVLGYFDVDNFTNEQRTAKFQELCNELNSTLPGTTYVEFEDEIPLVFIPYAHKNQKKASQELAEKLNSLDCYEEVDPNSLDPGLSKNYLYFTKNRDGSFKLNKKGKFKKRGKSWLESGFVIEFITKLFYEGEESAWQLYNETKSAISAGTLPLDKLQITKLVAKSEKSMPGYGFPIGSKPTIHYVWRGEVTGKRVIKKVFVPSADVNEPYSTEYYLDKLEEIFKEVRLSLQVGEM